MFFSSMSRCSSNRFFCSSHLYCSDLSNPSGTHFVSFIKKNFLTFIVLYFCFGSGRVPNSPSPFLYLRSDFLFCCSILFSNFYISSENLFFSDKFCSILCCISPTRSLRNFILSSSKEISLSSLSLRSI